MVTFDFADTGIVRIRVHYDHRDKCQSIPGGRWIPRDKAWEYLLTPATAACICQTFLKEITAEDRLRLQEVSDRLYHAQRTKDQNATLVTPVTKTPPWKHQIVSFNMVKELFGLDTPSPFGGGAMLALDMGCGKSKCAVDLIANYPDIFKKILVVCPASVIDVWAGNEDRKGQFEIHCPDDVFKKMTIHPVKGLSVEKKTKAAETARFVALSQGRQFIAVINYESAWREPFAKWAIDVGFDLVVLDECHRIKSPGGKASKYFGQLAKTTRYRLGLTGTPLPHSPLDIYGQYRFLDPGIFGTSFSKFRGEFAVMGGFQGHQILNYRNTDTLHNKMFLIAHRVMSKDVFDLPKFQSEVRTCELSPPERRIYQEMDINFCAQVANGEVTAANALVKLLRLQEITSGYLDAQPIGDSKKKLLADVLEDFDPREPLVIFARFTNDLRAIKEVAESQGRTYAELSGHANELSQWQIGNKDVLGVQIKSGREGVDFTRARYSIYYSLGFSLGDYEQSIKRLDRPGQVREGMYIHLLAKNTVDFKVMEALEKRQEVVSSVLNQYKGVNDFSDVPEIDDVPDMQEAAFP